MRNIILRFVLACVILSPNLGAQVKPSIKLIGGDDVPQVKQKLERVLETVLLEMNRLNKGQGSLAALKTMFSEDALKTFEQFVLSNGAYTARRTYEPQMIRRLGGRAYDIRSIAVKVRLGDTESSDMQSLVFSVVPEGVIVAVRAVIPNHDYQSVLASGVSLEDSLTRGMILDFMERFRIAYNTKDIEFLEKVYSDDALIIVGSVLRQKSGQNDFNRMSLLSKDKVKLVQVTKRQYLDGLKNRAFKTNAYVSVRFDSLMILRHEKVPSIYGVTCWQHWKSSTYSDGGYLFLMMDFRKQGEPVIHVRSWQPQSFDDGTYVGLYDFDLVQYKGQ
jgi:hypothetical protein